MWAKRGSSELDPAVDRLNRSLGFDIRLVEQDIEGSLAWVEALEGAGVLGASEAVELRSGLEGVRELFRQDRYQPEATDEDVHTAVERLLGESIGELAGKLHTGRSRNDQVATDFRLWVMRACDELDGALRDYALALLESAETWLEAPMPGYTHLRQAQPVTWGHWMLSHLWAVLRDRKRFAQAREAASVLPLGSGALAGTTYPIDREALAARLGFASISTNSIDGVSDRDFALEFLFAAAVLGVHLSRLAEGLILFSAPEFGFVALGGAHVTGSSLMPQKANPDALELARGKAGRLFGDLTGLLTTLKGLPSAYDKDLQEDKEPVFDAYDTLMLLLPALTGLIRGLQLDPERMAAAIDPASLATDLADYLVGKGLAFREAHALVAEAVGEANSRSLPLDQLPLESLQRIHPAFQADVSQAFDITAALSRRAGVGGTAPQALRAQLAAARTALEL